jgi:hypothetical protein
MSLNLMGLCGLLQGYFFFQYHAVYGWVIRWLIDTELEKMRKEAVMAQFELLVWHLHGRTDENHGKPQLG